MLAVTWNPSMSVGVEALDTDHKMLIALINQLDDAIETGNAHEMVASVMNALVDYTEYHFGREEEMMRVCGYPGLEGHISTHRQLVSALQNLREAHARNPTGGVERHVMEFMRTWLTDHILGTDSRYIPTLKGREADLAKVDQSYAQRLANIAEDSDAEATLL